MIRLLYLSAVGNLKLFGEKNLIEPQAFISTDMLGSEEGNGCGRTAQAALEEINLCRTNCQRDYAERELYIDAPPIMLKAINYTKTGSLVLFWAKLSSNLDTHWHFLVTRKRSSMATMWTSIRTNAEKLTNGYSIHLSKHASIHSSFQTYSQTFLREKSHIPTHSLGVCKLSI